jgi:hypothetical protein
MIIKENFSGGEYMAVKNGTKGITVQFKEELFSLMRTAKNLREIEEERDISWNEFVGAAVEHKCNQIVSRLPALLIEHSRQSQSSAASE